jgi:hypothetical protein
MVVFQCHIFVGKVSKGMRAMINEAVLIGDGIGKLQETSTSAVGHSDLGDQPAAQPGQFRGRIWSRRNSSFRCNGKRAPAIS